MPKHPCFPSIPSTTSYLELYGVLNALPSNNSVHYFMPSFVPKREREVVARNEKSPPKEDKGILLYFLHLCGVINSKIASIGNHFLFFNFSLHLSINAFVYM
jgi:hypothetical protein